MYNIYIYMYNIYIHIYIYIHMCVSYRLTQWSMTLLRVLAYFSLLVFSLIWLRVFGSEGWPAFQLPHPLWWGAGSCPHHFTYDMVELNVVHHPTCCFCIHRDDAKPRSCQIFGVIYHVPLARFLSQRVTQHHFFAMQFGQSTINLLL